MTKEQTASNEDKEQRVSRSYEYCQVVENPASIVSVDLPVVDSTYYCDEREFTDDTYSYPTVNGWHSGCKKIIANESVLQLCNIEQEACDHDSDLCSSSCDNVPKSCDPEPRQSETTSPNMPAPPNLIIMTDLTVKTADSDPDATSDQVHPNTSEIRHYKKYGSLPCRMNSCKGAETQMQQRTTSLIENMSDITCHEDGEQTLSSTSGNVRTASDDVTVTLTNNPSYELLKFDSPCTAADDEARFCRVQNEHVIFYFVQFYFAGLKPFYRQSLAFA